MRIKKLVSVVLIFVIGVMTLPCAQGAVNTKSFQKMTFTASNGVELPYRLYVPDNVPEGQDIPILTFLHGAGERGNDNELPLSTDCELLNRMVQNPEQYPCIIVVPQCGDGSQWVDTPWSAGNYSVSNIPMSRYLTAVRELLVSLEKEYHIDSRRRYITGLSMGGFGTWDMIMRYPRTFAAALPICGGADPLQILRLMDLPIRTYHGNADPIVPVSGTRLIAQMMELYEAPYFSYTEIEEGDHGIWGGIYRNPETAEWLFSQRRDDALLYWGDIDQDNHITATDALLVLQNSVKLAELTYEDADVADVNADGTLDAADALAILQRSVGLIDRFQAEGNDMK